MAKGYLINDKIEFWPAENRLSFRTLPGVTSQLTSPATRCLLILIEQAPDVVPQEVFFDKVWKEGGMHVPPNTLYQNISLVRRGLKAAGNNEVDDIIVTIPRQGFRIREDVTITEIDDIVNESVSETSEKNIVGTAEESLPALSPASVLPGPEIPASPSLSDKPELQRINFRLLALLGLLAVVAGVFIVGYVSRTSAQQPSFAAYVRMPEENGCKFFINPDSITNERGSAVSKTLINCKVYPWVYITSYKHVPVMSVISCNKPLDGKTSHVGCVSLFMRDVTE